MRIIDGPSEAWRTLALTRFAAQSWKVVKDDPIRPATLVAAIVLAVLSLTSVLDSPTDLTAATLAVLGLLTASLLAESTKRLNRDRALAKSIQALDELQTTTSRMRCELEQSRLLREVPAGPSITSSFEVAMAATTSWRFKGGTGTFLRAWTLPKLAEKPTGGARIPVTLDVLDPRDDVCEAYANYRRRLEGGHADHRGSRWTKEYVQTESAASIVAAVWYRQHRFMEVRLVLSRDVSALRYDVSSTAALVTHADRTFPALVVSAASPLYSAFVAELEQSLDAGEIMLGEVARLPGDQSSVTPEIVHDVLAGLNIREEGIDISLVPDLAFSRDNPYPR